MGWTFDPFYSAQYCTMLSDSASCCTAEIGACLQQRNGAILLCSLLVMHSHFASSCLFEAKIAAIFTLFPLIDAFRLCKLLLHLCSKDWCNSNLLSIGWCFQILRQAATLLSSGWCFQILWAAVSLQRRLVQCYHIEYWWWCCQILHCCMVAAKMLQYAIWLIIGWCS